MTLERSRSFSLAAVSGFIFTIVDGSLPTISLSVPVDLMRSGA